MFIELTDSNGLPFSVEKGLIKLYAPARLLLADDSVHMGTVVVVQGVANYNVLEDYEQVKEMLKPKRAPKKTALEVAFRQ